MKIEQHHSPNFNDRPSDVTHPTLIVIHGTAGKDQGDISWCCTGKEEGRKKYGKEFKPVSYHYIVTRDGTLHELVDPSKRAWHAGVSTWDGRSDCNDYSVGIALSLLQGETPTAAQYSTLAEITRACMEAFNIPMSRVVGHYHVSPGRKTDPWPPFDWAKLWEAMR